MVGLGAVLESIRNLNTFPMLCDDVCRSEEPHRLVEGVLKTRGLSKFLTDRSLIGVLSNPEARTFSRDDILSDANTLKLQIHSWIPSAYSHPYGMRTYIMFGILLF